MKSVLNSRCTLPELTSDTIQVYMSIPCFAAVLGSRVTVQGGEKISSKARYSVLSLAIVKRWQSAELGMGTEAGDQ